MYNKRLFIFAGYDKDRIVDVTLLHYLKALSLVGDIIFVMDNHLSTDELKKITSIPNIIYTLAIRHGEYDFGSYKRGYKYAYDNNLLSKYDWVYFVNDSVYGPLFDLEYILLKLENSNSSFTGLVSNKDEMHPMHIQSWFVGMRSFVICEKWFVAWMNQITRLNDKDDIIWRYECGLSQIMLHHGKKFFAISDDGASLYWQPMKLVFEKNIPFIKKTGIEHIKNINVLKTYIADNFFDDILKHASRLHVSYFNNITNKYERSFRLTLFGFPIVVIQKRILEEQIEYKLYLLDKIPVIKIWYKKIVD